MHYHTVMSPMSAPAPNKRMEPPKSTEKPAGDWSFSLVRVAGELFLERGYAGVSLADVMAQAGGSFRELYREFGSKEGLFLAAMSHVCEEVLAPWQDLDLERLPTGEALVLFGKAVLSTLLSPRLLSLHRLVLAEAARVPELAKVWYEEGPTATNEALGLFLTKRSQTERLFLEDPDLEASLLINSMVNTLQLRQLVGIPVTEAEIDFQVRAAVRTFLYGVKLRTALA